MSAIDLSSKGDDYGNRVLNFSWEQYNSSYNPAIYNYQHFQSYQDNTFYPNQSNGSNFQQNGYDFQQNNLSNTDLQLKVEPASNNGELLHSSEGRPSFNNSEISIAQKFQLNKKHHGNNWHPVSDNFHPKQGAFHSSQDLIQQGGFHQHQGSFQSNLAGQSNFWNSFGNNYQEQQYGNNLNGQYGWDQYTQETILHANIVKTEFNNSISNGDTSDLGSSINTTRESEDCFDLTSNNLKAKPIIKSKASEELWDWIADGNTLPKGWKKRVSKKGKSSKIIYLSPQNEKFYKRLDVEEHMMKNLNIYTSKDIEKLKLNYRVKIRDYTGWDNSDPTLPKGWFKRKREYHSHTGKLNCEFQYLSSDQQTFSSRKAIVAFMKVSTIYSDEDINLVLSGKLHGRKSGKGLAPVRKHTDWDNSDTTLPKGWFKRQSDYQSLNGKIHTEFQYLSSDQKKFCSRNAAAVFMKSSQLFSDQDIQIFLSGKINGTGPRLNINL